MATTASIAVDERTSTDLAAVPLNFTVALTRFVPTINTVVPTGPLVGANAVIVGGEAVTVNDVVDLAVPPGVVRDITPLGAPAGTVAFTEVAETTVTAVPATPLNETAVVPVRLVPVIVTIVPAVPVVGVKDVIVGGGATTVNDPVLVPVPDAVVTATLPLVVPTGTTAVSEFAESTENVVAATPLNLMDVAPVKPEPAKSTVVPTGPLAGSKVVMTGAAVTVNGCVVVTVPPGVVSETTPVVAPVGTVALTDVAETTDREVPVAPLNLTAVVPVRLVPVIVTTVPTGPLTGVNDVTVGDAIVTVNAPVLVPVPLPVVTEILPLVAPTGTTAVSEFAERTE